MPNTAHDSSSPGFVLLKHARLASIVASPQPQLAPLTERLQQMAIEHHRDGVLEGGQRPLRGVRQDKVALTRDRKASKQPASPHNGLRSRSMNSNSARSQSHHISTRRTEPLTLHPSPILKAELKRQAEIDGLSVSATGTALLEWAIRQKLHMQQAATLESAIEAIITRAMSRRDARLAHLLVRIAFAVEQDRIINTNILSRMPGVTPALRDQLLDRSAQAAKAKITHSSPQLEDILQELEEMLSQKEGREGNR